MSFRFRHFKVYQDAKLLHKEIVLLSNTFPKSYFYLIDQMKRSSLSILLNVAEGSSRQSDKDFNRYLAIALGSVDETLACLDVALTLELISEEQYEHFEKCYFHVCNQLGGFSKFFKKD